MTADALWSALIAKRPALSESGTSVTISAAQLRVMLAGAHAKGVEHAAELARAKADFESLGKESSSFDELFGRMFGR